MLLGCHLGFGNLQQNQPIDVIWRLSLPIDVLLWTHYCGNIFCGRTRSCIDFFKLCHLTYDSGQDHVDKKRYSEIRDTLQFRTRPNRSQLEVPATIHHMKRGTSEACKPQWYWSPRLRGEIQYLFLYF